MSRSTTPTHHLRMYAGGRIAAAGLALILGLSACSTSDTTPDAALPSSGDEQSVTATARLSDPTLGLATIAWLEGTGAFADLPLGDTPIDA
jgi:hypothetical protein